MRIEIGFDNIIFDGGLKRVERGWVNRQIQRGMDVYGITAYSDLDGLLGSKWFIRCFNSKGVFGYPMLKTVTCMLKERRPLAEYRDHSRSLSSHKVTVYNLTLLEVM